MHELALALSVVALVEEEGRKHSFARARLVRLEIGALSCVEPEALRFCFEDAARSTLAEGAALDIVVAPGRGRCRGCGARFELFDRLDACPCCNGLSVEIESGAHMRVMELEVE